MKQHQQYLGESTNEKRWMVGWLCPKTDPSEDVGEQCGSQEETSWAGLFLDTRSHRRQWNLDVCRCDTASGAAHNKPLTATDTQTPRLDRRGAPGRGNYHRKTKCSLLSIFFTSLLWRRWRNNLWLLSNCQVRRGGKSAPYVISQALEPWIRRQTQCQRRQTEGQESKQTLGVSQNSAPYTRGDNTAADSPSHLQIPVRVAR